MKKKSLVAMGLAGVMTIGMCVPVLAADVGEEITKDSPTKSKEATIDYEVASTYSVTLPAKISISVESTVYDFNGTVGNINDGESLNISVTGLDNDGALTLKDTKGAKTQTAKVTLKVGDTAITSGNGIVATYTQDTGVGTLKNDKGNFTVNKPSNDVWAGTYEGTVTFHVSLDNSEQPTP